MPRRKRKKPNRIQRNNFDSSSSDQNSFTANIDKRQCIDQLTKVNTTNNTNSDQSSDSFNGLTNINNSIQYTPLTSTPGMAYQPNFSNIYQPQTILKELCNKMSNVESKLTKLDKIEERFDIMDKKFSTIDADIKTCKKRLDTLEKSAQFLSNVNDEQTAIKKKLETISNRVESSNSVKKDVADKLLDIEMQSLENNLLFLQYQKK